MNAQATARNVRVAPRKARLVADLIRGLISCIGVLEFIDLLCAVVLPLVCF